MTRLINAVLLVLLTSLPALGRRVKHLEKVSLETETPEDCKKDIVQGAEKTSLSMDNLDLRAEAQGGPAKTLMQKFSEVDAHNLTQATGAAMAEFLRELKVVSIAIYSDAKAAARAEFYKSTDPGSGNALESNKEADAAAAALTDAETMLFEKTELLTRGAFGKETLFAYMLEGDDPVEKTFQRVLERFHLQFIALEIEIVRVGFNPHDIGALGELQSGLSALEGQVEALQGQELDGEEIDLTNPLLWEPSAIYWGIVKVLPTFLKVQVNLLRKIVDKNANDLGKAVKGTKLPPKMRKKMVLNKFLKALDHMEQRMEMEAIIKRAIEQFVQATVSTPATYRVAEEKMSQAVKATMDRMQTFDPKMKERQKAKINKAVEEKKRAMANVPD